MPSKCWCVTKPYFIASLKVGMLCEEGAFVKRKSDNIHFYWTPPIIGWNGELSAFRMFARYCPPLHVIIPSRGSNEYSTRLAVAATTATTAISQNAAQIGAIHPCIAQANTPTTRRCGTPRLLYSHNVPLNLLKCNFKSATQYRYYARAPVNIGAPTTKTF